MRIITVQENIENKIKKLKTCIINFEIIENIFIVKNIHNNNN